MWKLLTKARQCFFYCSIIQKEIKITYDLSSSRNNRIFIPDLFPGICWYFSKLFQRKSSIDRKPLLFTLGYILQIVCWKHVSDFHRLIMFDIVRLPTMPSGACHVQFEDSSWMPIHFYFYFYLIWLTLSLGNLTFWYTQCFNW